MDTKCNILALLLPFLQAIIFSNALAQDEVSMGTTILAVRYKGGVVVGADTRTSVSGYVSNRYAAKLTFVLDRELDSFVVPVARQVLEKGSESKVNVHNIQGGTANESTNENFVLAKAPIPEASTCVICRSGSAADTQHLASVIRTEIVSRQLLFRIRGTVTHVAALLRNLLLNEPTLSASLICAGYDHELGRGVIYSVAPGGTVFEERVWAAGGSGSTYILGHLDSFYPKHQSDDDTRHRVLDSEVEALDFVCRAIGLAMDRDGSSGGFIRMYVIDKYGKRFVSKMPDVQNEKSIENRIQSVTSLKNFAPAAPIREKSGVTTGSIK